MSTRFDELHDEQFERLRSFAGSSFTSVIDFLSPTIRAFRSSIPAEDQPAFDLHLSERLIDCWERELPAGYGFFEMINAIAKLPPPRQRSLLRSVVGTRTSRAEIDHLVAALSHLAHPLTLADRFMQRRRGREEYLDGLPYAEILYVDDEPRLMELWRYTAALGQTDVIPFLQHIADDLGASLQIASGSTLDNAFPRDGPPAVRMLMALELAIDVIACWGEIPDLTFREALGRLDRLDSLEQGWMARSLLRLREPAAREAFRSARMGRGIPLIEQWTASEWRELERIASWLETSQRNRYISTEEGVHDDSTPYNPTEEQLVWRLLRTDLAHLIRHLVASGLVERKGIDEWVARNIQVREKDGSLGSIDARRFADLRRGLGRSYATAPSDDISPTLGHLDHLTTSHRGNNTGRDLLPGDTPLTDDPRNEA